MLVAPSVSRCMAPSSGKSVASTLRMPRLRMSARLGADADRFQITATSATRTSSTLEALSVSRISGSR